MSLTVRQKQKAETDLKTALQALITASNTYKTEFAAEQKSPNGEKKVKMDQAKTAANDAWNTAFKTFKDSTNSEQRFREQTIKDILTPKSQYVSMPSGDAEWKTSAHSAYYNRLNDEYSSARSQVGYYEPLEMQPQSANYDYYYHSQQQLDSTHNSDYYMIFALVLLFIYNIHYLLYYMYYNQCMYWCWLLCIWCCIKTKN